MQQTRSACCWHCSREALRWMPSRGTATGSAGAPHPAATSPRPHSHPLVAAADLCEPGAFALPDHGRFLFLLSCRGRSSRSGEAYVVRELGRKFSLPDAPPLLPPCHPPASRVTACWGSWWKGRDGRRREGSPCLNSCCISLAPGGFPAWTPVGRDGLARQSSPGAGELGICSQSRSGGCARLVGSASVFGPPTGSCLLCAGEWASNPAGGELPVPRKGREGWRTVRNNQLGTAQGRG